MPDNLTHEGPQESALATVRRRRTRKQSAIAGQRLAEHARTRTTAPVHTLGGIP
jgi:hypothetical protein